MSITRTRATLLALSIACTGLGACGTPVGLAPSTRGEQIRAEQRSAPSTGTLSPWTAVYLQSEGLPPRATSATYEALCAIASERAESATLLALAEVAYAIGARLGGGAGDGWRHMTVSALASWAVIFSVRSDESPYVPQWALARTLHNASLAEVVAGLPELPGVERCTIERSVLGRPVEVEYRWGAEAWTPDAFTGFRPADDYRVRGVRHRHRQQGVGASLLGDRQGDDAHDLTVAEEWLPTNRQTVPLTAVIESVRTVSGEPWPPEAFSLVLLDPTRDPSVSIAGSTVPVEADFTAALVNTIAEAEFLDRAGVGGLLDVTRWQPRGGLIMLEPFDPRRIPVIFIHGLVSTPAVWREMVNDLWSDTEIRARYQFWFFMYPTGNPFAYSAAALREDLAAAREVLDPERTAPAFNDIVLIGHSMGGLIARLLVTDASDALWNAVSDVPFDEVTVGDEDRALLHEIFLSGPLPGARCAVFIATPHRGSVIADRGVGRFFSGLVRLPETLVASAQRISEGNSGQFRFAGARSPVVTGIDSLSPRSPFLLTLSELPFAPGVTTHSIIGRRSGGDGPGGTDGVVPFTSAHLPHVDSELIIADSNHSVPLQPAAAREVRRILRAHAAGERAD